MSNSTTQARFHSLTALTTDGYAVPSPSSHSAKQRRCGSSVIWRSSAGNSEAIPEVGLCAVVADAGSRAEHEVVLVVGLVPDFLEVLDVFVHVLQLFLATISCFLHFNLTSFETTLCHRHLKVVKVDLNEGQARS